MNPFEMSERGRNDSVRGDSGDEVWSVSASELDEYLRPGDLAPTVPEQSSSYRRVFQFLGGSVYSAVDEMNMNMKQRQVPGGSISIPEDAFEVQVEEPFHDQASVITSHPSLWTSGDSAPALNSYLIQDYSQEGLEVKVDNLTRSAKHKAVSSLLAGVMSLFNGILSAGVVAMPYYMAQTGLIIGTLILVFMAWLTVKTVMDLYRLSRKHRQFSYAELCDYGLGKVGYFTVCFFMFIFNYGGLVANLQLLGQNIPSLLEAMDFHSYFLQRWCILVYLGCITYPLCLFRNITTFKYNALMAVGGIGVVGVLIVGQAFYLHNVPPANLFKIPFSIHMMGGLTGMAYLFVCHDLSFSVYDEIKNPTIKRSSNLIVFTMFLTILAFGAFMYAGFFTFYFDNTRDANILHLYGDRDIVGALGRVILSMSILFSLPFMMFMPRLATYALISLFAPNLMRKMSLPYHFIGSFILVFSAVGIAIAFDELGPTYELVGAISAVGLAWVLPPILYIRLERLRVMSFQFFIQVGILIFGLLAMVGGTSSAVLKIMEKFIQVR